MVDGIKRLEAAEGFELGQGEGDFGFVVGISEVRGISAMKFTRNVLVLHLKVGEMLQKGVSVTYRM